MNQLLVVSQNKLLAQLLITHLELEPDFQVTLLPESQALDKVIQVRPYIVIAVINLERPAELALIKTIKADSPQSEIILLVSYIDKSVKAKASAVGATALVPLRQPEILLTTIYQLLEQRVANLALGAIED